MKNITLHFDMTITSDDENIEKLGEDLAAWLQESWFNGEDVLNIEYKGHN